MLIGKLHDNIFDVLESSAEGNAGGYLFVETRGATDAIADYLAECTPLIALSKEDVESIAYKILSQRVRGLLPKESPLSLLLYVKLVQEVLNAIPHTRMVLLTPDDLTSTISAYELMKDRHNLNDEEQAFLNTLIAVEKDVQHGDGNVQSADLPSGETSRGSER